MNRKNRRVTGNKATFFVSSGGKNFITSWNAVSKIDQSTFILNQQINHRIFCRLRFFCYFCSGIIIEGIKGQVRWFVGLSRISGTCPYDSRSVHFYGTVAISNDRLA